MDDITAYTARTAADLQPAVKAELEKVIKDASGGTIQGLSAGLEGYDLQPLTKLIAPIAAPLRQRIPRNAATKGALFTTWKTIEKLNTDGATAFVAKGQPGLKQNNKYQQFFAPYAFLAATGIVPNDEQLLAQGYDDLMARQLANLMFDLMQREDRAILGGQNYALPAPDAVTLTAAATGGSIAASTTVHVRVCVRTNQGYFNGGSSVPSADASVAVQGTDPTNQVVATVPTVNQFGARKRGLGSVVAYDWYVSSDGTNYFYLTTTTVNTVTINAIPTVDQPAPLLPGLGAAATWANAQTDGTADPNAFNGIIGTLAGDVVNGYFGAPNTGDPSGAVIVSNDGSQLHASAGKIQEIDDVIKQVYNNLNIVPSHIIMSADIRQAINVALNKSGAGFGGGTLRVADAQSSSALVAGTFFEQYMSPIDNSLLQFVTDPNLAPGTILLITLPIPIPGANVSTGLAISTLLDYQVHQYAPSYESGPNYIPEVRAIEAFENYAPKAMGIINNIGAGPAILAG